MSKSFDQISMQFDRIHFTLNSLRAQVKELTDECNAKEFRLKKLQDENMELRKQLELANKRIEQQRARPTSHHLLRF